MAPLILESGLANEILTKLEGGNPPSRFVEELFVGRTAEKRYLDNVIRDLLAGKSRITVWNGPYGAGKSSMLKYVEQLFLKNGFAISPVTIAGNRNFYSSGSASKNILNLYTEIIKNIDFPESSGFTSVTEVMNRWVKVVCPGDEALPGATPDTGDLKDLADNYIKNSSLKLNGNTNLIHPVLKELLLDYLEASVTGDKELKRNLENWFLGVYTSRGEARRDIKKNVITDDSYFRHLIYFWCWLFRDAGLKGLVIDLDNIDLIAGFDDKIRTANHDFITQLYDESYNDTCKGLYINLSEAKGSDETGQYLISNKALKSRLGRYADKEISAADSSQPLMVLDTLIYEERKQLLVFLVSLYNSAHKSNIQVSIEGSDNEMRTFIEFSLDHYIYPRDLIIEFLNWVKMKHKNPSLNFKDILDHKKGSTRKNEPSKPIDPKTIKF
ncbi:MAG: BREX system ATP-binding domain-containing protein [Bacteroidales bacterium]